MENSPFSPYMGPLEGEHGRVDDNFADLRNNLLFLVKFQP